jgi:hypothetical protein
MSGPVPPGLGVRAWGGSCSEGVGSPDVGESASIARTARRRIDGRRPGGLEPQGPPERYRALGASLPCPGERVVGARSLYPRWGRTPRQRAMRRRRRTRGDQRRRPQIISLALPPLARGSETLLVSQLKVAAVSLRPQAGAGAGSPPLGTGRGGWRIDPRLARSSSVEWAGFRPVWVWRVAQPCVRSCRTPGRWSIPLSRHFFCPI